MGRISKKNIISGNVANLVFRELNGKQLIQVHPGKIKQTQATQASSSEFTRCSSWAKHLRNGLFPFLAGQSDSYMYQRLTGQLYKALQGNTALPKGERTPLNTNMKELEGFEFNNHSPFKEYFLPELGVTLDDQRQVHITVPKLDPKTQIQFPPENYHAELVVLAYATNFEDSLTPVEAFFILPIEQRTAITQETTWMSPPVPEGYFVMVTAKLQFHTSDRFMGKKYTNSKTLNPAQIVFCDSPNV